MIDTPGLETLTGSTHDNDVEQTGSDPNLRKVRQILFGPQMRDFDTRLSTIAEEFRQEAKQTRAALDMRLDRIEEVVISELEQIKLHLREVTDISHHSLNDRLTQLNMKIQSERGEIQQQIEERYLELAYRVHELDEKLHSVLQDEARFSPVEPRSKLARLLNEAVQRLESKPEVSSPGVHISSVS